MINRRALVLLTLGACNSIADPPLDSRAEPFDPPPVYARWWAMTESCSKLKGSFSDISWFSVPGTDVVDLDGEEVGGYWSPVSNRIVLAGDGVLVGTLVRHEMLHALLRTARGHSRADFLQRCGGVVTCGAECVADAGPPPTIDASVARVTSEALEIATSLVPGAPTAAVDGGVFTIVVTARNPESYPVVVALEPSSLNRTFFFVLFGERGAVSQNEPALDPGVTYFSPGETKQQYFDLAIGSAGNGRTVLPGTYSLYGGFDNRWVTREGLVIGP